MIGEPPDPSSRCFRVRLFYQGDEETRTRTGTRSKVTGSRRRARFTGSGVSSLTTTSTSSKASAPNSSGDCRSATATPRSARTKRSTTGWIASGS